MKRLTLALTAATALSWAAVAQTTAPAQNPATSAPAAQPQQRSTDSSRPMFEMKQGQWRTSKLVGLNVYNNDEKIGDINELVVGKDGRIEAVVIGVGGFLGMGEHDVAVPFNQVKFMEEPRRTAARTDTRPATTTGMAPATTSQTTATMNRDDRRDAAATTGTVGTTPAARDARIGDTYRGYPDHAEVNMTKDQLRGLPQVRYAR